MPPPTGPSYAQLTVTAPGPRLHAQARVRPATAASSARPKTRRRRSNRSLIFVLVTGFLQRHERQKRRYRLRESPFDLVSRHTSNVGYRRFSLIRASSAVNCQFTLA